MRNKFIIFCFTLLSISCSVDPEIIPEVKIEGIKEIIPDGWPTPFYNFSNNPISIERFTLGKTLFYEPMLSSNNTISCGSCHQQFVAFSNAGHDLSHGINGLLGKRNSPALQNLNWNTSFMHDGGILNLEVQPLGPIANPIEQNENIANVVAKLNASTKYKALCKSAYGDEIINSQRILKSLAQFMGTMYSYNSKYDAVKKGTETFTTNEQNGYNVFVAKCASCHKEPLFTNYDFINNGIGITVLNDSGRAHITHLPTDLYKFKTPSLRNIEKSGPYMHDGRFSTLEKCLDHYASVIPNAPTLDPSLIGGLGLTAQSKIDIIAFLKTLTDPKFLTDKRFSE